MKVMMRVSVVIPAYNEQDFIRGCLEALKNQQEPPDEIIVVDNNCTDDTIKIARQYGCRITKEPKQGIIPARDKGFDTASYPIIARTDADTLPPPDWIKKIKKHFSQDPECAGLAGPVSFYDFFIKSAYPSILMLKILEKINGFIYFIGPNFAIKKEVWVKIKPYLCTDDSKVHEDFDLATHLFQRRYKICFDKDLVMPISARRLKKKPHSFFLEYPLRTARMIRAHKR